MGRRKLKGAGLIKPYSIFDRKAALGHIFIVGAKVAEGSLDVIRPEVILTILILTARCDLRLAHEPNTELRGSRWNGIVNYHPRHIGLRMNFQVYAGQVPLPPSAVMIAIQQYQPLTD